MSDKIFHSITWVKSWLYFLGRGINTYIQQVLLLKEVERMSALSAGIPACSLNKTEKKKNHKLQDQRDFTTGCTAMQVMVYLHHTKRQHL